MLLRKLQIFGFKSFADKTELIFGEGMTAVIGPNGCGKSNVVDAIRWVFGEQKASQLRSANMQDVIFSGTQNRHPLNMAEVVLTIKNNKGILPVEFSEVSISRRIYRSGESEYQLNKVPCRLRDIHNLFMDTGIGSSAYTTIENTMINSILSDKAEERRILFEEASGIGKYKQRRKESQRQLEKTRQDLLRIGDKVQEADRQVRMLARHVEKAKRYKTYFEDLKSLELGFENKHYCALAASIASHRKLIEEGESLRESARAKIATAESQISKMQLSALEKEKELEIASREVSEINEKIVRIDRDISVNFERLSNLKQNIARFDSEASTLDQQIEEATKLRGQLERGLVDRDAHLQQCQERVSGAGNELARFDEQVKSRRDQADTLGRSQIDLINEISTLRSRLSSLKSNLSNSLDRRQHDQRELELLECKVDEYRDSIDTCKQQLAIVDEEHRNLLQAREVVFARIEKEDARYQTLIEREKHLEAHIASSRSQRKFLEGLESAYEGYGAGVKELLKRKLPGLKGVLADIISVTDDASMGIIEKVLGSAVQTAVFEREEHLRDAIALLQGESAGEACMISLERLAALPSVTQQSAGNAQRLSSFLKVTPGCEVVAEKLLSSIYLTDTGSDAMDFILKNGSQVRCAGRDGVICNSDGTVVAGKSKNEKAGILQRKQQIEKLASDIIACEAEYATVIEQKDRCIVLRDEAKVEMIDVDEKLNKGQRRQQEQQTAIKHYEQEILATGAKMNVLHPEMVALQQKIVDLESQIGHDDAELAVMQNKQEDLEEQVERARGEVRAMEEERRGLIEQLKNVELESQGLKNRINQDRQDIQRLTRDVVVYGERKTAKSDEKRKAVEEIGNMDTTQERLKLELQFQCSIRTENETKRDGVRELYNGMLLEIEEVRKAMKADQADLDAVGNRTHDEQIKLTRDEQEQRRIRERIWEVYEVDLETPPEGSMQTITEDDDEVHKNIAMLRERIKHVGQVNLAALDDYETESARLKELTTQRDDLQTAVDDLDRAIKKLDKEARVQFIATFEQVQKNFTEMFTTLFEGGEAHIALEENVDPLEAPIHINVRPAGKKMRGVQLLSGGERALTAISLLFALYLVKPSAYCILDELDAPLDDANIGRFVKVLRKFAEKTQFIVITHNKRTMEAADLLYGVTQHEKGVSSIVSVRFDEDQLQAA